MGDLRRQVLAPLDKARPATAEKLTETLRAWLLHQGRRDDVAAALFVHPQTVRYRMHQLEELLGDRLADPDERLTLEIALRARRLLSRARDVQQVPRAGTPAKRASNQANASG